MHLVTAPLALLLIQLVTRVAALVNLWLLIQLITPAVLLVLMTSVDCLRPHLNFITVFHLCDFAFPIVNYLSLTLHV